MLKNILLILMGVLIFFSLCFNAYLFKQNMEIDEKIKTLSQEIGNLKKERGNIFTMPSVTEPSE